MNEPLPRFQFWVRRSHGEGAVFSIRFEVEEGKGLLRVARPGVLVDPPARESGFEERLTPAQVRASRFLHVWDGGRKRQGYVLSRLTDAVLNELTRGVWEQMKVISDGGFCWLVPGVPDEEPEDEPASNEPETLPGDALEPMDLLEPVTEADEHSVIQGEVLQAQPLETDPQETDALEPFEPDTEAIEPDAAATLTEDDGVVVELGEDDVEPALPPAETQAFAPFGRATTLVRHLRREKLRDRQQIAKLRSENERLSDALAEAEAREVDLKARLDALNRSALPE